MRISHISAEVGCTVSGTSTVRCTCGAGIQGKRCVVKAKVKFAAPTMSRTSGAADIFYFPRCR